MFSLLSHTITYYKCMFSLLSPVMTYDRYIFCFKISFFPFVIWNIVVSLPQWDVSSIDRSKIWIVYVDGCTTKIGSGAGVLLNNPDKNVWQYGLSFGFQTSNNVTKYDTLILGLQLAQQLGANELIIHTDS